MNSPCGAAPLDGELLFELDFIARVERLKDVRTIVKSTALKLGFSEETALDIVLAVDEAVTNIIRHAYGEGAEGGVVLRVLQNPEGLVIELHDSAPAVDPSRVKPRDLDDIRPGRLGTHLIREIMDRAELRPAANGQGNLLKLFKKLE